MKKIILITLAVFLLIFLATGFFFLETSSGLRFLFKIASPYLPGEWHVEQLEGKLAGPLRIRNLSYRSASFDCDAQQLDLDWRLGDLFKRKWYIKKFATDKIVMKWKTSSQTISAPPSSHHDWDAELQQWQKFFRRWRIQLDNIQIVHVVGLSNQRKIFQLDRASLNAYKSENGSLTFTSQWQTADNVLEIRGQRQKNWVVQWTLHIPAFHHVIMALQGSLEGQGRWDRSLNSHLEGQKLQWKGIRVGQFQNEFRWNPKLSRPFESHLYVSQVQWPAAPLHPISLAMDLATAFRYRDGRVLIDGDMAVSNVLLHSDAFTQTVTLPSEVEIVQKKKVKKTFALAYEGKVHLKIGPEVHVEVMGLRGDLAGNLTVFLNSRQLPMAEGTLNLRKGTYDFYGQTLKIKKGEVSFAHSMLTNPQLDIIAGRMVERPNEERAIQKTQKILVGVHVQGTVEDPQPKLFSDPAGLRDPDILSYLLLGQSMNEVGQDQSQLLLRAAQGLNVGGGGGITQTMDDIKHQLGLTELTVKTKPAAQGESSGAASLVVGKYMTRKLYVSYSMGITGASNLLKIRYLLSPKWSVEIQNSSEANGADLFYHIERN